MTEEQIAALKPFLDRAIAGFDLVGDQPDHVEVELVGEIPGQDEFFECSPLTLGDFRRIKLAFCSGGKEVFEPAPRVIELSVALSSIKGALEDIIHDLQMRGCDDIANDVERACATARSVIDQLGAA